MKKILTFLFLAVFGFSLLGCDNSNSNTPTNSESDIPTQEDSLVHEHTYDTVWSKDDTYHWYASTCGHENEVKDKAKHSWNEGEVTMEPDVNQKGEKTYTCSVCKATKVEEIEVEEIEAVVFREIEVDYQNGVLYVPSERQLKVAQFADAHFGVEGNNWHNDKIDRTKEYMYYFVEENKPDLIVCSGDNVIGTGIVSKNHDTYDLTEFVEFMESLQIPWTFMYGNHDAESKSKAEYSQFLLDCIANGTTKYLIYKEDYVEKADPTYSSSDEGRYGNFTIPVYDIDDKDKLLGAYIFFDAGTYLYDLGRYQTITKGQVDWYVNEITRLNELYQGEGTVPTIVFSHIQLPEHAIAYNKAFYKNEEGYEFVIRQDEIASDFKDSAVASQSVTSDSGLFNKMVELGSTKAVLVGHAHSYYFQVMSHGILLGYAPQCGFSKLFETNDDPRLSYMYNVNTDFTFTTTNYVEDEYVGKGLVGKYFDGTNGDSLCFSKYDSSTGLYTMNVTFNTQWSRIRLYFDNEVISTDDESYTFTGDYQVEVDSTSYNLSPGSNKANLTYCNSTAKVKCVITYNPETKTIDIDVLK